jgi:hypothetical protein
MAPLPSARPLPNEYVRFAPCFVAMGNPRRDRTPHPAPAAKRTWSGTDSEVPGGLSHINPEGFLLSKLRVVEGLGV